MKEQWRTFDGAQYLTTDADQLDYMTQSLETGDSVSIANALATVARAKGLDVAVWRDILSEEVSLQAVLDLLKALDMKLAVAPPEAALLAALRSF